MVSTECILPSHHSKVKKSFSQATVSQELSVNTFCKLNLPLQMQDFVTTTYFKSGLDSKPFHFLSYSCLGTCNKSSVRPKVPYSLQYLAVPGRGVVCLLSWLISNLPISRKLRGKGIQVRPSSVCPSCSSNLLPNSKCLCCTEEPSSYPVCP